MYDLAEQFKMLRLKLEQSRAQTADAEQEKAAAEGLLYTGSAARRDAEQAKY